MYLKSSDAICGWPLNNFTIFRYSRPNGDQVDDFDIEDDTHQTIGRCRSLESHNPSEDAIINSGHLAVDRYGKMGYGKF